MKTVQDAFCKHDFGKFQNSFSKLLFVDVYLVWAFCLTIVFNFPSQVTHFFLLFSTAVTAKLHRRRLPIGEPEFEVEGRVEFIHQGPLLPYDTRHLLQQWLLINIRCASALARPGRSQLYVLTGSVQPDGTLALTHLFPWHKKDTNIAMAIRKWKHHRC